MRWTVRAVAAALLTVAITAGPAAADSLRAYQLTVRPGQLEDLARAGYDVTEGIKGNHITVAATTAQAASLAKLGLKPVARGTATRGPARIAPDYGPTGGYGVFRPYARQAYDKAGAEVPNLVDEMKALAAANPGIVKLEQIGMTAGGPADDDPTTDDDNYTEPKPIYAVKVSRDAKSEPDGSKPAVLYSSTQHAREWISTEVNRRIMKLFISNYGKAGAARNGSNQVIPGLTRAELTDLVNTRELWFVLVCNPDGYDYTFESPDTRLWRKNLRDNNGDGVFSQGVDGVDPNRNFATHWGLDDEGSSTIISSETYRGPSAQSEPETKALDGLMKRVNFEFNNNFHSFAQLLLYPFGWQVNTFAADDPIFRAIAGSDENPAVDGFNPGVGAELYITNGDTNDHAYTQYDTLSFTPELDGGDDTAEPDAGGFVFQDVEADVEAEFEKQLQFSLDMARSAADPANVQSHLGNVAPDFQVDTFDVSYGDPQTVQVSAKRALGPLTLHWQIGDGDVQSAATAEWKGGSRYGDIGDVYYHRMRGQVTGAKPGDSVKVWFTSEAAKSKTFTYSLDSDSDSPVLILDAENYSGGSPAYNPAEPTYLNSYKTSLDALGIKYDVWDVDGRGLKAPDPLGVLSHYAAIVWFTGDDYITRYPGQPGGTGAAKVANDLTIAVRDRLNEGGKVLFTGAQAGQQYFDAFEYSQFGEPVANTDTGYCDSIDPDTLDGCIPLSNDFFQYWLGGYVYVAGGGSDGDNAFPVKGLGAFDGIDFGFDPAGNQAAAGTALVTSSVLPAAKFPAFKSSGLGEYDRPGAAPYDPYTGSYYVYSGMADSAYRRLTRTVDLTGKTGGKLDFQMSFDTEPTYDFAFVEAHTVGQDDWTTLPLKGDDGVEVTDSDTGSSCSGDDYTWTDIHPFLLHYVTFIDDSQPFPQGCTNTGTTGSWHALTGNSAGWQHLTADLSPYDGKKVELSISYAQDGASAGLGAFVDDARVTAGATVLSQTSFETDLGGWTVAGPPPGTDFNADDWTRKQTAFDESPIIQTPDSIWMTFGVEGIDTANHRQQVLGAALNSFGVTGPGTATPTPTPTASPAPTVTATPTATATVTATPTPTPTPVREIRIGRGPVRARHNGNVPIRIKCLHLGGRRCRGSAFLLRSGHAVGKRSFSIPMNRYATRTVRLTRATRRLLVKRGQLRMTVRVRAFNQAYGVFTKRVRITVLAPPA